MFPKITEVAKSNGNFPTASPTNGIGIWIITQWLTIGNDLDSFWRQTDRTLQLAFNADNARAIAEYNMHMNIAWHTAAMVKAKKMPTLSSLLTKRPSRRAKKPIPWQVKVEGLKRWHASRRRQIHKGGRKCLKRL